MLLGASHCKPNESFGYSCEPREDGSLKLKVDPKEYFRILLGYKDVDMFDRTSPEMSLDRIKVHPLYVMIRLVMIYYSQEDLVVKEYTDQCPSTRKDSKVQGFSRGLLILFYYKGRGL